jgi:hypothetical protein
LNGIEAKGVSLEVIVAGTFHVFHACREHVAQKSKESYLGYGTLMMRVRYLFGEIRAADDADVDVCRHSRDHTAVFGTKGRKREGKRMSRGGDKYLTNKNILQSTYEFLNTITAEKIKRS